MRRNQHQRATVFQIVGWVSSNYSMCLLSLWANGLLYSSKIPFNGEYYEVHHIPENIILSKRRWTQKATYWVIPFIWNVQFRQRIGGRGNWNYWEQGSFPREWKCSGIRRWWWLLNTVNMLKTSEVHTLKWCIVCYRKYISIKNAIKNHHIKMYFRKL